MPLGCSQLCEFCEVCVLQLLCLDVTVASFCKSMWFIKPKEDSRCGGAPPFTSIWKVGAEESVVQDKSQLSQLQARLHERVSPKPTQ